MPRGVLPDSATSKGYSGPPDRMAGGGPSGGQLPGPQPTLSPMLCGSSWLKTLVLNALVKTPCVCLGLHVGVFLSLNSG